MLTPNVELNNAVILITGADGFIGSNLVTELLNTKENVTIVGQDSVNDYYDVSIKEYRDGIQKTIQWYLNNKEWWQTIISGERQNYYEKIYGNR